MKQHFTHTLLTLALASVLLGGCKKEATAPSVTTSEVTLITQNTAISGCTVTDNGGANVTKLGLCWSTSPTPTVSDSVKFESKTATFFPCTISWLTASTIYYARAYATNSAGTGYGNTITFTTLQALLPAITSAMPTSIASTTVQCNGEVTSDGGAPTTRGACWGTSPDPTVANSTMENGVGAGVFSVTITGLTPNTIYYTRVYATNSVGTVYGSTKMIRTMNSTVTDIDGNVYPTVMIGTQEWMAENLRVTHYRNGDAIPNITDNTQWLNTTTQGAWCSYDNDPTNKSTYGLLYNYYTTEDSRGVCPIGWHMPSDAEWTTLFSYLGGTAVAGYKMKKVGVGIGDNSSGFTALMGGYRHYLGYFQNLEGCGYCWIANSNTVIIGNIEERVMVNYLGKNCGFSIRCIKDN